MKRILKTQLGLLLLFSIGFFAIAENADAQNARERQRRAERQANQRRAAAEEAMKRAEGYKGKRPNIIFLLADDQRFDSLGCYGNNIIKTPNIDRLAKKGVRFKNAFATTSICMTSRATILTGQYATVHGIHSFRDQFSDEQLANTYPAILKDVGYHMGFVGKWGVGKPPKGLFHYDKAWEGQNVYFPEGKNGPHLTRIHGDQAIEFIDTAPADKPFCLSVSFKAPHVQDTGNVYEESFPFDPSLASMYADIEIPRPATAAPEYFEALPDHLKDSENRARWAVRFWGPKKYQESVKGYYRLITGIDAVVGRIMKRLDEKGIADETVIIYTSDHGFYLGEKGLAGKWLPYDISMRIPLIIYDPHKDARHGEEVGRMVLTVDIARSILRWGGAVEPKNMQGMQLRRIVRETKDHNVRTHIFYEHLFEHPRIPRSRALRSPDWKFIRYIDIGPDADELYDLRADPEELVNLAKDSSYARVLQEMRVEFNERRTRLNEQEE